MTARIAPAAPPFDPEVQCWLDRTMPPGTAPLTLFTILANDPRLFKKFFSAGLLDRGHLTLRQREIVIARTTALCGSEYEWGVHIAVFGAQVGFGPAEVESLACGAAEDACWSADERLLLRLCDTLHESSDLDDLLWQKLRAVHTEAAILELLMLAGFYRTVSYLANALRLPLESNSVAFPSAARRPRLASVVLASGPHRTAREARATNSSPQVPVQERP